MSEQIQATIQLSDEAISALVIAVGDEYMERVKEDVSESLTLDDLNAKDYIEDWMSYNFEIEDYLRNVDFDQYIESPNGIDESEVQSLLDSYNPHNGCATAKSFTSATARAFKYLAHTETDEMAQTISWLLRSNLKNLVRETVAEVLMEAFKIAPTVIPQAPVSEVISQTDVSIWSAKTSERN